MGRGGDNMEEVTVVIEPLLAERQPLDRLMPSARNLTSQIALVGAKECPIESLDYEIIENDFFKQDWRSKGRGEMYQYIVLKWSICLVIGVATGLVGFCNNLAVESLSGIKFEIISKMMTQQKYLLALTVFAATNFFLILFSSILTAYIAPTAAGSGIPEVKAYLNGVDAPMIFSLRTLFIKILGSIGAVSSSLYVGMAGPLVHTGACISAIIGRGGSKRFGSTCKWTRQFKNDRDRRDFITCGSAAGIAAAFRAPVGGVLFALEELSSWWRSALLWRAFFTTAMVAVVLGVLVDVCDSGKCGPFGKGGLIMFSSTSQDSVSVYHLVDLPFVIFIGVIGGVLGSLYNFLLIKVLTISNSLNKKVPLCKPFFACTLSLFTSFCLFGLPWLAPCTACPSENKNCPTIGVGNFCQFQCQDGYFNDLASLIFNTNDDAIRNLFSSNTVNEFHLSSILLFFLASYTLSILGPGAVVPSGLFIPIITTGAAYGRLVGKIAGSLATLNQGLFAILGASSFLGGSMRTTVSLCVIILELTNNMLLLPLVMLVLLISKTVADSFNDNVFDQILQLRGLPYLEAHAEPYMWQLTVTDILTCPLWTLNGVEKVKNIVHLLKATQHNGFPVIDEPPFSDFPVLFGLILRAHLVVLLRKKIFLGTRTLTHDNPLRRVAADDFAKSDLGQADSIEDIELTVEELEMFVDLHPFTNASPYTVVETMSLAKALMLFRQVGLRHMLVVPKSSERAPVVGMLTRHDFMAEHILGLHPYLKKSKWKRLRLVQLREQTGARTDMCQLGTYRVHGGANWKPYFVLNPLFEGRDRTHVLNQLKLSLGDGSVLWLVAKMVRRL